MENKSNKSENMKFNLPSERVFHVCKDGKVELIIANKDFTKFRTLDQLIEMKGDITSGIVSISFGEIFRKVRKVWDRYASLFRAKKIWKGNGFVFKNSWSAIEEKIKPKKLQEYLDLKQKRDEELQSILAEPNKLIRKKGWFGITRLGDIGYEDDQGYSVLRSDTIGEDETWYFLSSGEMLYETDAHDSDGCYKGYYESVSELKERQHELQEKYDREQAKLDEEEQIEENTEKYLEF